MTDSSTTETDEMWEHFISAGKKEEVSRFYFRDDEPAVNLYRHEGKLDHANKVNDRLWVGGDEYLYDFEALHTLEAAGVTHVLDCRTHGEVMRAITSQFYTHPEMTLAYNCTGDDGRPKDEGYFFPAFTWAEQALEDPEAVLYVHCAMGINRGPSNAYAILRRNFGLNREQAMTELRTGRPGAAAVYWVDVELDLDRLSR